MERRNNMAELQAPYGEPLNPDQLKLIDRLLAVIREHGGFGSIEIEVKGGSIKFINLEKLTVKATGGEQTK